MWGLAKACAVALALLPAAGAPPSAAAEEAGASGEPSSAPRTPRPAWFAFPVVFYQPETGLGLGGLGGVHFAFEPGLPTSDVQLIAAGTARRQAFMDLRAQLFTSRSLALGAALNLSLFPSYFFGIGNDAPASAREPYTSRSVEAQVSPEWYVVEGRLRTGPRVSFRWERFSDLEPGGQLASGQVTGTEGYASAALGWSVTWDSRDSRFAPRSGSSVEAWYLYAPGATRDRLQYGRGALDARQFLPLGRSMVLGVAGHLEVANGSVPFTLLPLLGGDRNLRGYYQGRWRDRLLYAAQAELRFPIAGRFGGVAFGGISDVASRPSDFGLATLRPAAGAGLRYRLTDTGLNVRLDVGVGQEGANVYFNLGEAF